MKSLAAKFVNQFEYLAWIPCVIGKLDYSKITTDQLVCDQDLNYSQPICFSYINKHVFSSTTPRNRYNVVSSVYNWKDRKDPEQQFNGYFRMITLAQSGDTRALKGTVFILSHKDIESVPDFFKQVIEPLKTLELQVNHYEAALTQDQYMPEFKLEEQTVINKINEIRTKIEYFASNPASPLVNRIIAIDYRILQNGLLFLKEREVDEKVEKNDAIKESNFIATKQSFIYLKYILHTHKHHNGNKDRLTSIHYINQNSLYETAFRLVDDLHRSIIEIKEHVVKGGASSHSLKGFISYAKSLVLSLSEVDFISDKQAIIKNQFFDNMLLSWQSVIDKSTLEQKLVKEKLKAEQQQIKEESEQGYKWFDGFMQGMSMFIATTALGLTGSHFILSSEQNIQIIEQNNDWPWLFPSLIALHKNPVLRIELLTIIVIIATFVFCLRITLLPHIGFRTIVNHTINKSIKKINIFSRILVALRILLVALITGIVIALTWYY